MARLVESYVLIALLVLGLFERGICLQQQATTDLVFARANGTHFVMKGQAIYLNGFNAYWLMSFGADPSTRHVISSTFQEASKYGMNVARTWAFNDGGSYRPLQISPGSYDEQVFKGLDFVISEAKKYGIYLILGLVNNWKELGGRPQYVQWARERGQQLNSNDDFYTNKVVKTYYKNHVKTVLTRKNSITGVAYRDDPTIFAWELMNEPRSYDSSGRIIQEWFQEMAKHAKSIDNNHLLELGLEGFYGPSNVKRNPNNFLIGTDFISNNQITEIDFASIHLYPEAWLPNLTEEEQAAFADRWIQDHIQDSKSVLGKPLVIGEFGKSFKYPGYSLKNRDTYFKKIYDAVYKSSKSGGPFVGGLFWQLLAPGMDNWGDGYQVVLQQSPSTARVIADQSQKLSALQRKQGRLGLECNAMQCYNVVGSD